MHDLVCLRSTFMKAGTIVCLCDIDTCAKYCVQCDLSFTFFSLTFFNNDTCARKMLMWFECRVFFSLNDSFYNVPKRLQLQYLLLHIVFVAWPMCVFSGLFLRLYSLRRSSRLWNTRRRKLWQGARGSKTCRTSWNPTKRSSRCAEQTHTIQHEHSACCIALFCQYRALKRVLCETGDRESPSRNPVLHNATCGFNCRSW